ncbi:nuclear transport factor 2 family protein [Croceicoccus gelatinilyticus]|uniref:nuclear transport factor 2 family protein n=1 Tax=Croceicoccus gelatinilyticus TaxID=2835536 RepID=UPI001BD11721|nr:nuclear transport factor 2 family protein [Croceicoccus gelatinilyticus]MBS7670837.1 nuclear transport factor 2 family protein [Croceicoccus gelatinilyticus]
MTDIEKLLAKDAIRDLAARYMRGQDRLDADLQMGTFWPDSTTDYGIFVGSGPDFVRFAQALLVEHIANQHLIGQHLIWFDEDDADMAYGEVYFYAFHRIIEDGESIDMTICGRYIDRYERRDGEWRFAHRSEVNDWARKEPAADAFLKTDLVDALIGRHDMQDRSYDREWLKNA